MASRRVVHDVFHGVKETVLLIKTLANVNPDEDTRNDRPFQSLQRFMQFGRVDRRRRQDEGIGALRIRHQLIAHLRQ